MKPSNHAHEQLRPRLSLVVLGLLVAWSLLVLTTPVHEAAHWVMSTYFDPYVEVIEFHPFGTPSSSLGDQGSSSILGCVVVKEAYPGALNERPLWMNSLQEIICTLLQLIITCLITFKILKLFVQNPNSVVKKRVGYRPT